MDLKSTYNKIAEHWDKDHEKDTWWIHGTDKFISLLKPGSLVLDVGCGSGQKAEYLVNHGLKIVGTDFSEKMIELAKQRVPNADFFVHDLYEIKNLPYDFDAIYANAVLLHVPKKDVTPVIRGFISKIKPGGYLYIKVKQIKPGQKEERMEKENDYGLDYERFFSYFTLEEIIGYLKNLGLKIYYHDIELTGRIYWILVIAEKI
ncbi:MAG TPA: class I SAM-dependent methyltransferase [Patescibacteria group bacterium]|nr:class I SAM-dependent methyltransferase [Patescibacteria group bacterium]